MKKIEYKGYIEYNSLQDIYNSSLNTNQYKQDIIIPLFLKETFSILNATYLKVYNYLVSFDFLDFQNFLEEIQEKEKERSNSSNLLYNTSSNLGVSSSLRNRISSISNYNREGRRKEKKKKAEFDFQLDADDF